MPVIRVVVASGAVIIHRRAVRVGRGVRLHVGAPVRRIALRRMTVRVRTGAESAILSLRRCRHRDHAGR